MRFPGKPKAGAFLLLIVMAVSTALIGRGAIAMDIWTEVGPVPDEAVYLGTDMGGAFVIIERKDIALEDGKMLPAFHIEMYWAASTGKPYGVERIGGHIFTGLGLYIPAENSRIGSPGPYEPPEVDVILRNGWVNSEVIYFQPERHLDDLYGRYTAMILPIVLD